MVGRGQIIARLVAVTAGLSVAAQFVVAAQTLDDPVPLRVLWSIAGYFTILTNVLVAVVMLRAAGGVAPGTGLAGTVALSMIVVPLIYHTLLARLWAPAGMAWWADQGLHSAAPALTLVWWLRTAGMRGPARWRDLAVWLIWPAGYLVYAMLRQAATGFVAYPFLDIAALGVSRVAVNSVAVLAVFLCAGAGLVLLSRRLQPASPSSSSSVRP